jgi:hypothetical protein
MNTLRLSILSVLILALAGCTQHFEEYNENPNAPEQVTPDLLFRNVLYQAANRLAVDAWNYTNPLAQLATYHDFNDYDRYDRLVNDNLWNQYYFHLRDLNSILRMADENPAFEIYRGPVTTIRAMVIGTMTDLWGDVPYSNAVSASDGVYGPSYDRQEDIYSSIMADLKTAAAEMEDFNGGGVLAGDIMYNGNLVSWVKFANSLRLRYLLRASKQMDVKAEMQALVDADNLITTNADNAKIDYLATSPNEWFFNRVRSGDYTLLMLATELHKSFTEWTDPRMSVMFRPNEKGEFKGLETGINEAWKADNVFEAGNYSLVGTRYRELPDAHDAFFIHASDVHLIIAEAAAMGLVSANAQLHYETGIQENFSYLGVELPASYLTQASVSYTAVSDKLFAIRKQKWVANFGVGFENFFDLRRYGWADLEPAVANVNANQFPKRFTYPETEQATNGENYKSAVAGLDKGDNINSTIWLLK